MTSATTSQAISGAAQGAALGAQIGGLPGAAIGGFAGLVGGLISGGSADDQFKNQQAWARYNNQMVYQTELANITSSFMLTALNINELQQAAKLRAEAAKAAAEYNAGMVRHTQAYNNELSVAQLERVWNAEGLDLDQLEHYRERERGTMVADRAASGTTLDEGSNTAIVVDQMTQEALDATIIRWGADIKAADIKNQQAAGNWQANVKVEQILWEGEMTAFNTHSNTSSQARTLATNAFFEGHARYSSATQKLHAGTAAITQRNELYSNAQTQALVAGLFQAGGTFAAGTLAKMAPGGTTVSGAGGHQSPFYKIPDNVNLRPLPPNVQLAQPGSSLLIGS